MTCAGSAGSLHADRAELTSWIAVDDHPEGWAEEDRKRLIQTASATGLSDEYVRSQLYHTLRSLSQHSRQP
ncbi:HAD domain-containing protein [Paludibacterium sp. B53371]|uniref:HAD domain-containing protein n=1 Tax=Paludibacterium sp. B53371 TaxID=2806263 RepID=UPI00353036D9